jgi:hypothetical protein
VSTPSTRINVQSLQHVMWFSFNLKFNKIREVHVLWYNNNKFEQCVFNRGGNVQLYFEFASQFRNLKETLPQSLFCNF